MKRILMGLLAVLIGTGAALAQETSPAQGTNLLRVAAWDEANQRASRKEGTTLLRRGVVADRQAGSVTLLAESCGLDANATVEFGIVGESSDRTYEALFRVYARAIDLSDALEYIGLPRGKNVSNQAQRYWPTGERIQVHVLPLDTTNRTPLLLEDYILDRKTGATLAPVGFTYCGSPRVPNPDGDGEICLADLDAPVSILSLYNEPQTVLDVPRQAAQGSVYENYTANPATRLPASQMVRLVLTPETRPSGKPRMRLMDLSVEPTNHAGEILFTLKEAAGEPVRIKAFGELLKRLMAVIDEGCDPLVRLRFDEALPLARVREVCKVIQRIEGENGIRMEPPPEGQLFYKAYLPDEKWRERTKRLSQPWELHIGRLSATNAVPPLRLVKISEDWSDPQSIEPKLTAVDFPLTSFDDLPRILAKEGPGLPVLLVFAPNDAPIGQFLAGIRRVLDTHPTIYVFAEP